ncbi:unnamed protein product [Musa textilis]
MRQGSQFGVSGCEGGARNSEDSCNVEDDDRGSDGNVIPPHVIVARRMTEKLAFSVCIGNDRALKGRDLSRVRNSILHMTGFLEP